MRSEYAVSAGGRERVGLYNVLFFAAMWDEGQSSDQLPVSTFFPTRQISSTGYCDSAFTRLERKMELYINKLIHFDMKDT